jgi:hypothetical protein
MSDPGAGILAIFGCVFAITLLVMFTNKPVEKSEETFEKREW